MMMMMMMMMMMHWQCEGWISEAAIFLQGISREAPLCTTVDDVDRLIKKIEDYRMEGYKDQDGRLNGMNRIVTDLYGQFNRLHGSLHHHADTLRSPTLSLSQLPRK